MGHCGPNVTRISNGGKNRTGPKPGTAKPNGRKLKAEKGELVAPTVRDRVKR